MNKSHNYKYFIIKTLKNGQIFGESYTLYSIIIFNEFAGNN